MSLFQNTVLKKYRQTLPQATLDAQWEIYKTIFHDTGKQANIRSSKEEQYQEGFLRELFVQVLGYIINPDANFNITTELKNLTNSKKADGAIIIDNNVLAVIELKGTDTTDLGKIEAQAFGYKTNQRDCRYVIISNFEKLRFYIDDATEFVEFNLFTLSKDEFTTLWLCLSFESIQNDLPAKLKAESVSNEDKITKELYKDYSAFRKELFNNIVALNPQYNKLELFKKTQKLLDRFLFIFFAEDRLLLPTNLIFSINLEWQKLREARIPVSLYDRYKMYFDDLNTGARVSLPAFGKHTNEIVTAQYDIYAYNGGLFQTDELLDSIAIDDDLLFKHTKKMSEYDFESEVDVNILGHIFENSLNEIDEIASTMSGFESPTGFDKTKTKRKKDGVFYTPKYITKYIVDNTIGKLCTEKKAEQQLDETQYTTDKRIQQKTKKDLLAKLETYRSWLLELTIVDPACGSGAFLNQALEFLIAEHRYVDELQAKLFGDALVLSDVESRILENNLYGVDLNEESVEIAKLSLWLRTAQRNRKLNSLNNNIKCGNSLIDDPEVAGDKAFNWQQAFPKVFAKGGFDVVIGNPPYVNARNMNTTEREYIIKKFPLLTGAWDLYVPFLLKVSSISKNNVYGWIIPNKLLISDYAKKTLEFLKNNGLNKVINISSLPIFENVGVYPIILLNNNDANTYNVYEIENIENFSNIDKFIKKENIFNRFKSFSEFDILINSGTTGFEAQKIIPLINEENQGIDFAVSGSIDPYKIDISNVPYMKKKYQNPKIKIDNNLIANSKIDFWNKDKVVIAGMTKKIEAYYSLKPLALGVGIYGIYGYGKFNPLFLLSILNSKFLSYYLVTEFKDKHLAGGYLAINKSTIQELPLVEISLENQKPFEEKAESMLSLNKDLQEASQKFQRTLQRKFELADLSKKLQDWYLLSYGDFIKELAKKKIKLSLSQEAEWEDYFMAERKKALDLKAQIDATDKAIDAMVYELYGLSEEEIKIVES